MLRRTAAICRPAAAATCNMRSGLGADLAITGVVQKVSNLILNINIYVRDVHTGRLDHGDERRFSRQYR